MKRQRAALLCTVGAIAIAIALADRKGAYGVGALALVTLAAACAAWAAALGRPGRREEPPAAGEASWPGRGAAGLLLRAAVVVGLGALVVAKPGQHLRPIHPTAFHVLAAMALAVAAAPRATATEAVRRLRFPLLALLWTAMAVVVIHNSPHPFIDVWHHQQIAAEALWNGRNPYAITYPNIYPHQRWLAPELLSDGRVKGFTYPPLTTLVGLPGWLLLGDVRFALLACTLLSAWAIRHLGRGAAAEDAALLLLFHPRAFFMLDNAWTEPLLLAPLALALVAARELRGRSSWMASGAALGLAAASKQFSLLVLPPFVAVMPRLWRGKVLAVAGGVAAATLLPFLVMGPRDLWHGLVTYQLVLPFREDSLSWMVPIARALGRPLPWWPAFAAALAALAATFPRRSSPALAATSAWATLSPLLLLSNRSHFNYYWLAMGVALLAAVLHDREATEATPHGSPNPS
ncbi:MAG TPA: glycosyltransferase 87 family protein [Anaeromyxobacteraceae bacterium]